MRKREKVVYIIVIALITAIFTLSTPPEVSLEYVEEEAPTDTLVVEPPKPVFYISEYDSIFRACADTIGWDWKMLAAVAYVESRFDSSAVSAVGAKGLMQVMPRTARAMGVPEGMEHDPAENVRAAAEYIRYLSYLFRYVPERERLNFILASYNAGFGHVQDAMRLASKYGKSRHVWTDNVELYLSLKSDSVYYNDSVCRNGRFGATETIQFVRKVQKKYNEYCIREKRFEQALINEALRLEQDDVSKERSVLSDER